MGSSTVSEVVRSRTNRAIRVKDDADGSALSLRTVHHYKRHAAIAATNGYQKCTKKEGERVIIRIIMFVTVCVIFAILLFMVGFVAVSFKITIQQNATMLSAVANSNIRSEIKNKPLPVQDMLQHNVDSIDYDYDLPISANTTERLPDPTFVIPYPNQQLIILVLSHRNNCERRTIIRQTWGRTYLKSLLFVIGGGSSSSSSESIIRNNDNSTHMTKLLLEERQQLLMKEQELYRDLLDTGHPESYRGLPHKLRYAIHWVTITSTSTIHWILKLDDDMYLRDLQLYNSTILSSSDTSTPVVMGCIQYNIPVQRYGKWAEDVSFYEQYPIYPPWPKGSCGYLFNHVVANIVTQKYNHDSMTIPIRYQQTQSMTQPTSHGITSGESSRRRGQSSDSQQLLLPSYQGEDTSLGIWLQHSNVTWIDSPFFVNNGNCNFVLPTHYHRSSTFRTTKTAASAVNGASIQQHRTEVTVDVIPWSIGHKMTTEQIQYCYNFEKNSNNDWTGQYSPFDSQQIYHHHRREDNIQLRSNNESAYDVAMMRHSADQYLVRRQHETQRRFEERERRKHLQQ